MREYLLGALGVALAYPVLWYQMEPEPSVQAREVTDVREVGSQPAASTRRVRGATRQVAIEEATAVDVAASGVEPVAPPRSPRVRAPNMPVVPLPEALPKTIDQMSELQRLAHDPMRLAERVQGLESNAAELEALKTFAEKFVTLPPDRVDQRIMQPSGRPAQLRARHGAGR